MTQQPTTEQQDSQPRQWPKLLIAALVLHAWTLVVMWMHGFPRTTADYVAFKQPAYMRLHTDNFSIPSYEGRAEHIDLIFSYPTPVYFFFSYLVFRVFGFSLYTLLAGDLAVHFLLVTLATWSFWRLTRNSWLAACGVLALAQLMNPLGRPEEMGILFALAALMVTVASTRWRWLVIPLLGLCGATTPGAAVAATVQVVAYIGMTDGWTRRFWWTAGLVTFLSAAISVALYFWFVWPYAREALEQLAYLNSVNYTSSLRQTLLAEPIWGSVFVVVFLSSCAATVYLLAARPAWLPLESAIGRLILAMALAIAVSTVFNVALGRPPYDYRLIFVECMAIVGLAFSQWLAHAPRPRPVLAAAGVAAVLLLSFLPNRDFVRYFLASALWGSDAVSYTDAVATIHKVVPRDASIGGDSAVFAAVDDGRPFYAVRWVGLEHWPDYIVTTQWNRVPYVLQEPTWHDMIEKAYVEVTPDEGRADDAPECRLFGIKLPVTTGRYDWAVRIWKRRASAQ